MTGKINIVFGFLYLVLTAALGPYMILELSPTAEEAAAKKQAVVGELQLMAANDFEQDLEPMSAEAVAEAAVEGLLALNGALNARAPIDAVKANPHAHGNLEAMLNIVAGLTLLMLSVAPWIKQLVSWIFILGALLHSGILYLLIVFDTAWAATVLDTGVGPILILVGLLLLGLMSAVGLRRRGS